MILLATGGNLRCDGFLRPWVEGEYSKTRRRRGGIDGVGALRRRPPQDDDEEQEEREDYACSHERGARVSGGSRRATPRR